MTESVASGKFVAQHLNDGDIPEANIQPNGVDLTVEKIYRTSGQAHFFGDEYEKPDRTLLTPSLQPWETEPVYKLPPGQYPIVYSEKVEIPEGYVGRVYPRSRLMRSGLHLTSALWDQGYEGVGEGLLQIPRSIRTVTLPVDMAIGQMVFEKAEKAEAYDGSHQGERVDIEVK